jgi:DNA-binding ferritin-like protein (Dps family)
VLLLHLIKAIVECAINTLNANHKLNKDEKRKLKKYKNRLRALVNHKISFKSKRKSLVQKGGLIVPLFTSILSGVIGALINNNS